MRLLQLGVDFFLKGHHEGPHLGIGRDLDLGAKDTAHTGLTVDELGVLACTLYLEEGLEAKKRGRWGRGEVGETKVKQAEDGKRKKKQGKKTIQVVPSEEKKKRKKKE